LGVGLLAILSGAVTYGILSGLIPWTPGRGGLIVLLLINLTLGLSLGALIAWRLVRLWTERKSGRAGARLHVRLVTWFGTIAVVPAILIAIFAAVTLNLGLEAWFSDRVKEALGSAVNVAQHYMNDHERDIIGDANAIADGIQRDGNLFTGNKVQVDLMVKRLAEITRDRGLAGSFLLDSRGTELATSSKIPYARVPHPGASDFTYARTKGPVLDADAKTGTVTALIPMQTLKDAYLLVVRQVDPQVFGYYNRTKLAVSEYDRLDQNRSELQLVFAALYAVVSLVTLLGAVWAGIWAANRLVRPISNLVSAAERVSEGDLTAQVKVAENDDELANLGHAFNRMTSQLAAQRADLMTANRLNDERRRFTETVLSGVSAGVIGLDRDGNITIINRAAARLLNATPDELEGRHYAESVPELGALIRRALSEPAARASGEVTVKRTGSPRQLSVQVSSEPGNAAGFIVTFDDITDLVGAQRTAAWADVARRIAHEIKNPLTPIQLSAERLKRKYTSEVSTDPEIFQQCIDTIIRQVGDIGRMVDEFSSFARMPRPVMRRENAAELLQQAVFLQRVAHPDIAFAVEAPKDPVFFEGDGRLISQALTNVLKNAGEGIAARLASGDEAPGKIAVALQPNGATFAFKVSDNGIGLPAEHRHRLTEPYVTTRAKGTGLGLAIVRKIMEDHGGEIALGDAESGEGAEVILTFPLVQKTVRQKGNENEQNRIADHV
jgi:two-component system nitrogen regulation sensor histidine kinase NtrY